MIITVTIITSATVASTNSFSLTTSGAFNAKGLFVESSTSIMVLVYYSTINSVANVFGIASVDISSSFLATLQPVFPS